MTEAIEIELDRIYLRDELSPRDGIDDSVVREYADNIADLPPILVAKQTEKSTNYILIDGWHRYRAHELVGDETIKAIFDAELKPEDFFFRAICSNKAHGIRFTAAEKKRISKYLFMSENRSATEISQAIGCSVRHATDLIKSLAHEKKALAIRIAKKASAQGYSERDIADILKKQGFKASKSGVNRWLQPEPVPMYMVKDKDAIQVSPQIGESPKRDATIEEAREIAMQLAGPPDEPIMNLDGEVATVAPMLPESKTKIGVCPKCKIRTVRVPTQKAVASCTRLFFYCDKCKEYIWLFRLLEQLSGD